MNVQVTLFILLATFPIVIAFQPYASRPAPFDRPSSQLTTISRGTAVALFPKQNLHQDAPTSTNDKLFNQFQTSKGEILHPYKTLEVSRTATREEIKKAYYKLSRKYHPDSLHHRSILPGGCNTLQDVEDHWERIKLSHEILVSKQMRCRYDRCDFIADPGAAVQRAVSNGIRRGIKEVGNSIWNLGSFTVQRIVQDSMTVASNVVDKAKNELELHSGVNTAPNKDLEEQVARGWASDNLESPLQPTDYPVNDGAHRASLQFKSSPQTEVVAKETASGDFVAGNTEARPRSNDQFDAVENFARGFSFNMPSLHLPKMKLGKGMGALQEHVQFFKPSKGRDPPKRHVWDPQTVP